MLISLPRQGRGEGIVSARTDHEWGGLHNRWFLDPVLKGEYPEDMLALYSSLADVGIREGDMNLIAANHVGLVGVNYYSSARVRAWPDSQRFGIQQLPNPNEQPVYSGDVHPEGLYEVLVRIDREYGHPWIYITENAAASVWSTWTSKRRSAFGKTAPMRIRPPSATTDSTDGAPARFSTDPGRTRRRVRRWLPCIAPRERSFRPADPGTPHSNRSPRPDLP